MPIIESREEKPTEEETAIKRRKLHSNNNGIDEPKFIPKAETEFDMSGWGISFKTEGQQKVSDKKPPASPGSKE